MLLFEDYGNLTKINQSFFYNDFIKEKVLRSLSNPQGIISPNSEIYIDKLKPLTPDGEKRHTWKYLTDVLLTDNTIAAIIIRSNKRQLLMVSHNPQITYGNYVLAWSDISLEVPYIRDNFREGLTTGNDIVVRNRIANTVKMFIEAHENAKKNWDVMIIKVDNTVKDLRTNRKQQATGREIKPYDPHYADYVSGLRRDFKNRVKNYIEARLPNFQNSDQLITFLQGSNRKLVPPKLKFHGFVFNTEYDSTKREGDKILLTIDYTMDISPNVPNYVYQSLAHLKSFTTVVSIQLNGTVEVEEMYFYSYNPLGERYTLEDFGHAVQKIQDKNEE